MLLQPDSAPFLLRRLGLRDYDPTWEAMRAFTEKRRPETSDEIWLLEHSPVFTLGRAGREEHLFDPGGIPVVRTDRGGQATYHGPGQLIVYLLLDLRSRKRGVRWMVSRLEQSVIELLRRYGIEAMVRSGAPGVYVDGAKIASLGLRVRKGCTYHGLSLNVDMDLGPFSCIDPCGHPGMRVTQLAELGGPTDLYSVGSELAGYLGERLEGASDSSSHFFTCGSEARS